MLIEMALVVVLMGIILGPVLHLLATHDRKEQVSRELHARRHILEALEGFVLATGRLPCPATQPNGMESRSGDACTASAGWLPTSTLGLWGVDGKWKIAVATLAQAGEPAQNALVSDQPFSDISPQQLAEVIMAPTTANFNTGSGPLPAIHLCQLSQGNPVPAASLPGCGVHPLLSVSAVWVAYPEGDALNKDRHQQFFINPDHAAPNPVWLSFERMNWLWMKRGSLDTFYIQEN
ncbi:MAG TPA: type II secretion system protein [Limnobacter sp.]|nr:type II secretion system protein [Limnobacter sp.]